MAIEKTDATDEAPSHDAATDMATGLGELTATNKTLVEIEGCLDNAANFANDGAITLCVRWIDSAKEMLSGLRGLEGGASQDVPVDLKNRIVRAVVGADLGMVTGRVTHDYRMGYASARLDIMREMQKIFDGTDV